CESLRCRRQMLLAAFGEDYPQACGNCDNCLQPPRSRDGTVDAQKALSCVYRTGQRYGVGHLVDVLRGKDSERIRQLGHDRLSTFGIGADLDERGWKSVFRQLVALGLLDVDLEGYGSLYLTAEARPVLRGEQTVRLREDPLPVRAGRERRGGMTPAPAALAPEHQPLFEALRALRAELAREQSVPAYVIFHDATLRAIAEQRPASLDELARSGGGGASTRGRCGRRVRAVVEAAGAAPWGRRPGPPGLRPRRLRGRGAARTEPCPRKQA